MTFKCWINYEGKMFYMVNSYVGACVYIACNILIYFETLLFNLIVWNLIIMPANSSVYLSFCLSCIVYLFICLSVYLCICLSVYLCICVSVYLCICVSVYLSICLSVNLSICLSVHLYICLSVNLCFYLSSLSTCQSVNLFICPSVYLSICLTILTTQSNCQGVQKSLCNCNLNFKARIRFKSEILK